MIYQYAEITHTTIADELWFQIRFLQSKSDILLYSRVHADALLIANQLSIVVIDKSIWGEPKEYFNQHLLHL